MSDLLGIDVSQSPLLRLDKLTEPNTAPDYWKLWQRAHSGGRTHGLRASRSEGL